MRTTTTRPKTYDNLNGCLMEAEENASGDKWTELLAPGTGHVPPGGAVPTPAGDTMPGGAEVR